MKWFKSIGICTAVFLLSCANTRQNNTVESTPHNLPQYNQLLNEIGPIADFSPVINQFKVAGAQIGAAVFTGSSTIAQWKTLDSTYKKFSAINRGLGGSTIRHIIANSENLIFMHQPQTVVLYIGDNDAYKVSADIFKRYFECFVANFRHRLPKANLILIGVKPSPARTRVFDYYRNVNNQYETLSKKDPKIYYIDIWGDIAQKPSRYFLPDGLHLNDAGYSVISKQLTPLLEFLYQK